MATPAVLYQAGDHASRPASGAGCVLYSCTDHDLVYRDDGSSWTTFMTLVGGSGGDIATDAIWDAAGDLAVGSGANTAAKLTKGSDGTRLEVESGALAWKAVRSPARANAPATDLSTTSTSAVAISTSMDVTVTVGQSGLLLVQGALVLRMGAVTADVSIQASPDGGTTKGDVGRQGWDGAALRKTIAFGTYFTGVTPGSTTVKLYWFVSSGTVFLDGASRGSAQLGSWVMAIPL